MGGRGVKMEMFQSLLEEAFSVTDEASGDAVKYVLGILKDFERRATSRDEFMLASEARHFSRVIRDSEEGRQRKLMNSRQTQEKSSIQEAHVMEAVEFNRAWTANMEEFEQRAASIIQDLRTRQEDALNSYVARQREEALSRVKHSKAVLDLMQVQDKLARTGHFAEAQRCQKKLNTMARREATALQAAADEVLRKKVEAFKASQRLEMEALVTRIGRGRGEHRGHWTQGANRLMQSHKNMLTDLALRQNLEVNRAAVNIKTELRPVLKNSADHRSGIRSAGGRRVGGGGPPSAYALPPPRLRPSRLPPPTADAALHHQLPNPWA